MTVQDKLKAGEDIHDARVGRYVMLMAALVNSMKSITGQDFKSHAKFSEWWLKNKANFKVQD